jgi:hypothetical protein
VYWSEETCLGQTHSKDVDIAVFRQLGTLLALSPSLLPRCLLFMFQIAINKHIQLNTFTTSANLQRF